MTTIPTITRTTTATATITRVLAVLRLQHVSEARASVLGAAVHDRLVASVCNAVALLMLKVQTDQQPSNIVTN